MLTGRYAHITGWGAFVPERIVTNEDLAQLVPTSDQWIRERTGIAERRIADEGTWTSTMGIEAGRRALHKANLPPGELDLIICATSTPDYLMPNTGSLIQNGLSANNAAAFDLNAACSGFVYGMAVGAAMIRSGTYDTVLVIGSEAMSRVMNWSDRATCVLFGDGAGAVLLQASDEPGGLLSSRLGSDGSGGELLTVGLGTRIPLTHQALAAGEPFLQMSGQQVFRFATRIMAQATGEVVEAADLQVADIDLIVPHQANTRILQVASKQLGLPIERIYSNLHRFGNTSAASIPLALVDAIEEGRVHAGDHVVMVGFGGGLTWGACLIEWTFDPQDRTWSARQRSVRWTRARIARARRLLHQVDRKLAALGGRWGRERADRPGPWDGSDGTVPSAKDQA